MLIWFAVVGKILEVIWLSRSCAFVLSLERKHARKRLDLGKIRSEPRQCRSVHLLALQIVRLVPRIFRREGVLAIALIENMNWLQPGQRRQVAVLCSLDRLQSG